LNGDLAFVTMPGEPFVEYQMQWRARCPLPNSYFLGYTNGSFGLLSNCCGRYSRRVRSEQLGHAGGGWLGRTHAQHGSHFPLRIDGQTVAKASGKGA